MFLGLASTVLSVWSCQKRLRASHSTRSRIGHDGNSKKDEVGHWQRCEAYKTFASGEMGSRVLMSTIKSVVALRALLGWMAGRCLTTTFSFAMRTAPRESVTEGDHRKKFGSQADGEGHGKNKGFEGVLMKGNTHNESKQHQKKHRAQNQHCKAAQSAFEFGLLRPVRQSFGDAAKAVPRPVALTRAMADPLTTVVPRKQLMDLVPYRWCIRSTDIFFRGHGFTRAARLAVCKGRGIPGAWRPQAPDLPPTVEEDRQARCRCTLLAREIGL